ncbi:MAG: hypothetical protein WA635_06920, partial [Gallionella sp.]
CRLETGRTHQIRVHMAYLKHPLVGDRTYAKGTQKCVPQLRELLGTFPRQALHATRLALVHPVNGEMMEWQAPLPQDMQQLLKRIREAVSTRLTTPLNPPLSGGTLDSSPDKGRPGGVGAHKK